MDGHQTPSPPFSIQLLKREDNNGTNTSPTDDNEQLLSLLPASYRTELDNLAAANLDVVNKELDLQKLDKVIGLLWVVGRPMPPRPLHYQLLLSRTIFITEQMDMHLVWTTGRMFLKPIPRIILEPRFWAIHLSCEQECLCKKEIATNPLEEKRGCERRRLWMCALGFLFSYAALISHESDFLIAKEMHLLPAEVQWPAWRTFVKQLDTEHIYDKVHGRFKYGELRLSRLNKIYRLSQRPFLRGYMSHWHQYGTFFQDNFAWLASGIAYIAIVLTAMQVGLATKSLAENDTFQSASYGFTVFSILSPLFATGFIIVAFCYIFVSNWASAVSYHKKRSLAMETMSGTS